MKPCPCCGQYPTAASMQQQIADYIKANPGCTRAEIRAANGLSESKANNFLMKLAAEGRASNTGRGRGTVWYVGELPEQLKKKPDLPKKMKPIHERVWAMGAV